MLDVPVNVEGTMPLMLLAGVVLCSLLFVVYTLVRYFEAVSPLKQAIPQLRTSVEAKRTRLGGYEQQIVDLREVIPRDEGRLAMMERWVQELNQQNDRLKALAAQRERSELEKQIVVGREGGA
tara:strand:+ start:155 stop:523 length:369 start_codon:yes stop_codon:yes gene_type:complete